MRNRILRSLLRNRRGTLRQRRCCSRGPREQQPCQRLELCPNRQRKSGCRSMKPSKRVFQSVTVTRSDGKKVQTGGASSNARDLVVSLPPLQPGKYQVRWQATSADSHRIQGSFGFEISP